MTENFNRVTCPKCGYEENPATAKKCEICGHVLKKGNSLAPILAGTAAAALLGTLGYLGYGLVKDSRQAQAPSTTPPSGSPGPTVAVPTAIPGGQSMDTGALMSWGDQVLFKDIPGAEMAAGAAAYAQGDYQTAADQFQRVRQATRGEPEPLIYLNNARLGATPALGVAVVAPISDTPNAARELLRGVAQAQEEAIKAGVPIKVLIADDNNNPDQARAIAEALIQDPEIVGVIGHGTSTTTLVAAPLYQQAGLPMIAPTSTSTELATLPRSGSNLIFRVIASDQFTGTALARHLLSGKQQKPIVFYNAQSSYSKSLLEAFSTTIGLEGGQVVKTVDLSQGDPAGELQGAGADSLVLLPDSKSFEAAIAVAKANQGRLPILAGDAFYRIETLEQAGANLKGAVLAVPWHPRQSNPQFAQAAAQLWGGDINWRTALSYDALQVLKAAATGNLTPALAAPAARQALAEALGASGFSAPGATGVISFLPSGDRNSTVTLVRVQPGQRSGTGFDFVPLN